MPIQVSMQYGKSGEVSKSSAQGSSVEIFTSEAVTAMNFSEITVNKIRKIGDVCILEFTGTTSASLSTWKPFLLLPDGFALADNTEIQFNGVYNDSTDVMGLVHKSSNPDFTQTCVVTKTAFTSGKKVSFSLCYVATA